MPNNQSSNSHPAGIPKWLIIILGIVIALSVLLVLITWLSKPKNQAELPPAPEPIFSWVGQIKSISESRLTLSVPAGRNDLQADKEVTVIFNDDTVVTSLSVPKQIPADMAQEERQGLFKRATITPEALEIGDDITVVADSDIRDAASFTAERIESRSVQVTE